MYSWPESGGCSGARADLQDVHGLMVALNSDPWADGSVLKRLVTDPFKAGRPGAAAEARAVLKQARCAGRFGPVAALADLPVAALADLPVARWPIFRSRARRGLSLCGGGRRRGLGFWV